MGRPTASAGWADDLYDGASVMKTGQVVRIRTASSVARDWKIPPDARGTVVCSYETLSRNRVIEERLDVRFTPRLMVWGTPAHCFEIVEELADA